MAKRKFLGGNIPLPVSIAAELAALKPAGLPDFGQVLLVLPGKVARSNVRRQLLTHFPNGLLLPQLLTPHLLMHYQLPEYPLPTAFAEELLWGKVLGHAASHKEDYPEIFPGGKVPPEKFMAAGKLRQLRLELAAGGFSIADAASHLGSRGGELSRLEYAYCRELRSCGFADPLEIDRQAVNETAAFAGVEKIILAGMPDLPRMLQQKLAAIDENFPGKVEIWIGADAGEADFYDQWGVPVAEMWEKRAFECAIENIHVAVDPVDGAHRAMALAASDGVFDPAECAVVLADQSLYEDFAKEFSILHDINGAEVPVGDPAGVPLGRLRLCRLLNALLEYLRNDDDFLYAADLLRQADFLAYAAGKRETQSRMLTLLDEFQQEMMPDNFHHALVRMETADRYRPLLEAMQLISSWKKRFDSIDAVEFIRQFFTGIYSKRPALLPVHGVEFDQECEFFNGLLENFAALPEKLYGDVDKLQLLDIFFRICRDHKVTAALPPGSLYFEGRLEMPFLTQKRIVFCGMNENFFPDRIDLTPFLTDSIRRQIGIRSNRETLVRSLCHLQNVCRVRPAGNVHLIVLRADSDQSAIRPSGIFFGGDLPEKVLLERCAKLFRDPSPFAMPETAPGKHEFTLQPQLSMPHDEDGSLNLSVTDFDNYLGSPFNCYWERMLKMQSVDYSLCEPDPALGGTLCHVAFEKLPLRRLFPSAEALEAELHANFDHELIRRYGAPLPVLIKLYAANMKQRLTYGARELFKSQAAGFELICTEYKFGGDAGYIHFHGANIRGKVDRIEYDRTKNILRIIDIKTGKVDNVIHEHCNFNRKGELTGFSKLQLPLYVILLKNDPAFREICPQIDTAEIECAYLVLPSEVTASALQLWSADELAKVLDDAETKAAEIIEKLKNFDRQEIDCKPDKITMPLLKPDAARALQGISWQVQTAENDGAAADPAARKPVKSAGAADPERIFPALPALDQAGRTRCCDCPPEIRANCACQGGDCTDCKAFNGFKSFNIITASAGTGKTYALASRFIQLLDYGAKADSILAITFTKKAAGEIFDRIVRRICDLAVKSHMPANCCRRISHERVIGLIRELLGNQTKELQISTIDSFFMQLLQAFAPEFGIWGEIVMADENDDRFLRRTIHRWIRSIHDPEQLEALRELLKEAASGDSRSIHNALCDLTQSVYHFYQLKIRQNQDGSLPQLENSPWNSASGILQYDELIDVVGKLRAEAEIETGKVMVRRLKALAGQLEKCASGVMYGKLDEDLSTMLGMLNDKNGGDWLDTPLTAPLNYWRGCKPRAEVAPLLRAAFRHIRMAALRQCRAKNLAVFSLISEYDRIYSQTVRSAGNITFADLPALLCSMDEETRQIILGPEDHSLEFRLDRQIKHYMFDEFQDTSDVQMQVFDPLLKELFSQLDTGDFRSFFCVGDIKQSIYQWRGGNPELFNYIANLLRPIGEQLGYDPSDSLVRSYRSSQAVMDTVNAVFCSYSGQFELFHAALKKMAYLPHVSFDSSMPGHTALINMTQESTHTPQNYPAKTRIMADIIREIKPLQRGLTVGVLVPTNKVAKEFAGRFKSEYGMPVSVDGTISPVDSMAFNVFRELLVLAAHPGDVEAHKFLQFLCFSPTGEVPQALPPRELAAKLGFAPNRPLDETVRQDIFTNGLGGFARRFARAFIPECTAFDRSRLMILCDAAEKFNGSPDEFLRQVDHLGKSDNSLDETIQIMTYHKSKGLEFDIVFMPDPTIPKSPGGSCLPEAEVIHYDDKWQDSMAESSWVSYMPDKNIAANVPRLTKHFESKETDKIVEKCCTLYVAMTRAKSALYILASRNNPAGSFAPDRLLMEQLAGFGAQNSDAALHDILAAPELADAAPELLFSHGDWHWYIQQAPEMRTAAEPDGADLHELPQVKREFYRERAASGEKTAVFAVPPEKRFAPVSGKNIGSEVHELFEKLRFADDAFDAEEFCRKNAASETAARIFCTAMADGSPIREALREPDGEYELWCERRFLLLNGRGETVPGAFDRVVIFRENGVPVKAHIIDYKSDRMETAGEYAVYFPQLASYRESLSIMLGIPPQAIECSIFALKIRQVIDVPVQY